MKNQSNMIRTVHWRTIPPFLGRSYWIQVVVGDYWLPSLSRRPRGVLNYSISSTATWAWVDWPFKGRFLRVSKPEQVWKLFQLRHTIPTTTKFQSDFMTDQGLSPFAHRTLWIMQLAGRTIIRWWWMHTNEMWDESIRNDDNETDDVMQCNEKGGWNAW